MSKYQKRHYEDVARILRENGESDAMCWESMRDAFVRLFAEDNPHFEPGRFSDAAYPGGE